MRTALRGFVVVAVLVSPSLAAAATVEEARQQAAASPGAANVQYDLGLALMQSIEGPLRAGTAGDAEAPAIKEAEEAYLKAIKIAPNHGRAHIMLGMLYRFTKRLDEAIPHLKTGMTLPPASKDWVIAASTLVDVYFEKNEPKAAVPVLEKLVKQHPDDAREQYRLGLAYMFTGKKPKAAAAFKKVLKLTPDDENAKKYLAEVTKK